VVERLRPGIAPASKHRGRERRDTTSAILLETIMADKENHIDYLLASDAACAERASAGKFAP
jgi:bacterioferritin (cytochrome b1)